MTATIPAAVPAPTAALEAPTPSVAADDRFARELDRVRPEPASRASRDDHASRDDRAGRADRHERADRSERADRNERTDHNERNERPARARNGRARAGGPDDDRAEAVTTPPGLAVAATVVPPTVTLPEVTLPTAAALLLRSVLGEPTTDAESVAPSGTEQPGTATLGRAAAPVTRALDGHALGVEPSAAPIAPSTAADGDLAAALATPAPSPAPTAAADLDGASERPNTTDATTTAPATAEPAELAEPSTDAAPHAERPTAATTTATAAAVNGAAAEVLVTRTARTRPGSAPTDDVEPTASVSGPAAAGPPPAPRAELAATITRVATTPSPTRPTTPAEQLVTVLRPLQDNPNGTYELHLELKPPELGRVEIRVEMRDGVMHAHLRAEQPAAAAALRDSLAQLRDHLAGHGVPTGALDVDTGGTGGRGHTDPRDLPRDDVGRAPSRRDAEARGRGDRDRDSIAGVRPEPTIRPSRTTDRTNGPARLDVHA